MSTQSIRTEVWKTLENDGLDMAKGASPRFPPLVVVVVEGTELLLAPDSMLIVTVSDDGYRAVLINDSP